MTSAIAVEATGTVRLPVDLLERLTALSVRSQRPVDDYVADAVRDELDDLEYEYAHEQEILARVEGVRSGRVKTIPEAEARRILGLDD
jgi:predicted DNA-binding protein